MRRGSSFRMADSVDCLPSNSQEPYVYELMVHLGQLTQTFVNIHSSIWQLQTIEVWPTRQIQLTWAVTVWNTLNLHCQGVKVKERQPWITELIWNLTLDNSRFWSLWVTVLTLSSSFSTTLEVIIEPTAAESNKPYVINVLPFSALTLSGTTLSNSKLFLLCSVVALFTNILDTARGIRLRVGSNMFNRIFCRNLQQRMVILRTITVLLSTTGLFWAVLLQMSVRQTSVAKSLKPSKSSPPTYALRQKYREFRIAWAPLLTLQYSPWLLSLLPWSLRVILRISLPPNCLCFVVFGLLLLMIMCLYTAHIPIRFMAVYNSFLIGRGWDLTSACKAF